jgi:hypothetical protein
MHWTDVCIHVVISVVCVWKVYLNSHQYLICILIILLSIIWVDDSCCLKNDIEMTQRKQCLLQFLSWFCVWRLLRQCLWSMKCQLQHNQQALLKIRDYGCWWWHNSFCARDSYLLMSWMYEEHPKHTKILLRHVL